MWLFLDLISPTTALRVNDNMINQSLVLLGDTQGQGPDADWAYHKDWKKHSCAFIKTQSMFSEFYLFKHNRVKLLFSIATSRGSSKL